MVGKPLETHQMHNERLPKWKALAVFSSDALSSVAYATQEILIPLALVSAGMVAWSLPIGMAIVLLLLVVSVSYWQTIRSYPNGGGAYIVVMENLGVSWGLVTGAALLIDYVLTVSVSIAAGVEAIGSAIPFFYEHRVITGCIAITIVTIINLRGVRESGSVFAIPTYLFIFSFIILLTVGWYKIETGELVSTHSLIHETYPEIGLFLLLRAFASGCTALTGIEAISNGVPAFQKPEAKNARITLAWMAVILGFFFIGITAMTHLIGILPEGHETVISQVSRRIFGNSPIYYLIQFSTALILFLAANTSFADFPRVCSLLANDRFLPRQLASLGDRLVFSNGIMLLGMVSAILLVIFSGTTHYLIPLYAIGVFLSFTLSQWGMVRHHFVNREAHWGLSAFLNGMGGLVTGVVLIVITITKFSHGAWIVVVLIPLMALWFRSTREHYRRVAAQLTLLEDELDFSKNLKHVVVIPISGIHRGVVDAIKYARSISSDVRVLYVELDPKGTERLQATWKRLNLDLKLVVLHSPYRSVVGTILDYIKKVDREDPNDMLTVVIPEFVTARWWHSIYHNQTALLIRAALLFERGKVVTTVRYHLSR